MNNLYAITAVWVALALIGSMISIRIGLSVALVEIVVGAIAGNLPLNHLIQQTDYTAFLASIGSVALTFLAGAEIDPVSLKRHWRASVAIGVVAFLLPFLGELCFCAFVLHWNHNASLIGGIALSTTSVAVVYAVMVETGLNRHDIGKLILAACFVNDLGTVLALGGFFANYDWLLGLFVGCTIAMVIAMPQLTRWVIHLFGHKVSEPEIKFLLFVLLALGGLATAAGSEAVLPAYVIGLAVAGVFHTDRIVVDRLRTIAFALLTPFFFLHAGLLISGSALLSGAGIIALLFLVKMVTKLAGVWPTAAAFKMPARERNYTTLLMATGLTFGSISALYGLNHHFVTQTQYSELVTVVILSALIPTLFAQQFFLPHVVARRREVQQEEEALGAEDVGTLGRTQRRGEA